MCKFSFIVSNFCSVLPFEFVYRSMNFFLFLYILSIYISKYILYIHVIQHATLHFINNTSCVNDCSTFSCSQQQKISKGFFTPISESVRALLGRHTKILVKYMVKLETKGDKTENRVLVSFFFPSERTLFLSDYFIRFMFCI